ncbi:MAG: ABC transporter permease [Acidimicrobiales bacterium]|nr:ABC transporter permease [Acidimicrobiales bacterium]
MADIAVAPDDVEEIEAPAAKPRRKLRIGLWLAGTWMVVMVVLAILIPWLPIMHYQDVDFTQSFARPSGSIDWWFGADKFGHSIFGQVLWGARTSLTVGFVSVVIGMSVGGVLGMIAGFYRGWIDRIFLIVTDAMLAFPALILLLAMVSVLDRNLRNIVIALAILSIPSFARLARANTLVYAEREFVMAARSMGAKNGRLIFKEILPNVALPLLSYMPIVVAVVIVAEGSLAFLGLSLPPPRPSWGEMINAGRDELEDNPHVTLIPGAVMFATVLSLNWIGQRLRQIYDPRESSV